MKNKQFIYILSIPLEKILNMNVNEVKEMDDDKLLTREEFKKQVFARTNGKCCVPGCDCDAIDAHHS